MNNAETIHERIAILVDRFGRGCNTASVTLTGSNEDVQRIINKGEALAKHATGSS